MISVGDPFPLVYISEMVQKQTTEFFSLSQHFSCLWGDRELCPVSVSSTSKFVDVIIFAQSTSSPETHFYLPLPCHC